MLSSDTCQTAAGGQFQCCSNEAQIDLSSASYNGGAFPTPWMRDGAADKVVQGPSAAPQLRSRVRGGVGRGCSSHGAAALVLQGQER